jgi:Trk K+ transport system NAD-binding subunit
VPRILIAGSGALAAGIERELRTRGAQTARLAPRGFELEAADLAGAQALVLAADDDTGNVDLALRARRLDPALSVVVRLFDPALASYLGQTLSGVRILSMSAVAAPVFADAARAALETAGAPRSAAKRQARKRSFKVDPILGGALLALFVLVFPSAAFFAHALDLRYIDALYFVWTTVMTVGYGDIALKDAADGVKLYGMALMLAGAAFIAILFALLSDWVLSRRLDLLRGRTPERGAGHVIVAGAGNIGYRVCGLLRNAGRKLVVIERDAQSRNASALAALGHHVIVADATTEETLHLAGLSSAALVLALTDSDAVNLHIALRAKACGVRVIMRADSPELSAHVASRGDAIAYSPMAAATADFAAAVLRSG